ncbi:non-ribosomal peptide synthetase [Anthocerotibacter panamensis]|uniref:non-ribosomal peptide synthetase n=1 Tax=Anthocerotibacter panamensis TaxID=2857077 RepID=UPI001C404B5C|nr:non-ribosomal peptide synthetase [Anthocerotibacter panamensis]
MNLSQLLSTLAALRVELWMEGEHLRYRAPKATLTPGLLAALRHHKAEICDVLQAPTIHPLTYGQRALWFLHQLNPTSASYNVALSVRICSGVEPQALRQVFQDLVTRHAALRTVFPVQDGEPVQRVQPVQELSWRTVDAHPTALYEQVMAAYSQPFDLEAGPLLRVDLFTQSQEEHVLLVTLHHIVSDAWSLWLLLEEVRHLYPARVSGQDVTLTPPATPYSAFGHWQTQLLANPDTERLWDYWRTHLAGDLPQLWPPRHGAVPELGGQTEGFRLTEALTLQLNALARKEGATLYMTLLAAFQVLLARYSGQEDILVGSPTTGRNQEAFARVIGYFVNPVVLRAQVRGDEPFTAFLGQVRATVLAALAHQDYPFALLVQRLQKDHDRTALFQASFNLQKPMGEMAMLFLPDGNRLEWGGLALEPYPIPQQEGQFDLTLEMVEARGTLYGVFKYNADLFDREQIIQLTQHFQNLLAAIVHAPNRPLAHHDVLSPTERHQLLVCYNDTHTPFPETLGLHQLVERQVARTPERIAVSFEQQTLTYHHLNGHANQLAHHLQALGVGPGTRVGICLERSLELVIALLGVLKAGGAYVPLDPSYPTERLAFMAADSQIAVLVTAPGSVPWVADKPILTVSVQGLEGPTENLTGTVTPMDLAYVMYTSGSTGKPKGVMTTHRALVNRLWWMQQQYPLTAEDRVLQKTPFSFDVSVWEFFWPLLSGARLVMARPGGHKEPGYLRHVLEEQAISVVHFVPSLLQVFLEQTGLERCHRLRHVFCSGEALTVSVQERFFERLAAQLHNLYGPTEAAIDVSAWTCVPGARVVIGRPIANTELYILDAHLQPVPIGVAGELHIGGTPLAQGYWNQPQLTAQKFIPHPFRPQERLYKTGDRARFLRDGTIAYLGRIDHQVKLRGLRIELGEIEALLREYVREAVVLLREDAPGDKRLVAYVVGASDSAQLRGLLQQKVPEYMVPGAFVFLEAMPLTPNGKVDRRALPAPAYAGDMAEDGAPRTPVEELLVRLWAQVLGLPQVGIHDNFFALGGHSLLATQVIARVRETFGVEVPLRGLFEAPTIAAFAAYLPAGAGVACLPLDPIAREGALPLSFAQQRLWFLEQLEGPSSTYNIPAMVRLSGSLDRGALHKSLQEVVQRHEVLRTTFAQGAEAPVQVIAPALKLDLPEVEAIEQTVEQLATAEAQRPFDLEQGPLLRCTLLKLGATEHVLLLTVHHIAADGWSLGVLIRELACLYPAFLQDRPHSLQPLPIQYADFAHWQRHYLTGERLERHLTYWQEHLTGAPPLLALPTDHPRPTRPTFRGSTVPMTLSREETEQLKHLSQEHGVTLFMTLLAAYAILLARYSAQDDLVVGCPIANRTRGETEGLLGFFVNTLPLRINLAGEPSFEQALARVREVTLGGYAHQDLPLEHLVEVLQPERNLNYNPLFQVALVLNPPLPALELPGLHLTTLAVPSTTAKFDLTLALEETAQGLTGVWEYNRDLFEAETIIQLTQHFQNLLAAIVHAPNRPLAHHDVLSPTERHQLLVCYNDTHTPFPETLGLHQLVERQVARTPERIAVSFEQQTLTYHHLNGHANRLAHHLQALGVGPGTRVGICLERSLELVIALLGVLKAGGAYVPLDPSYPTERLAFMAADSQIAVLVTAPGSVPWVADKPILTVSVQGLEGPTENLTGTVTPMDLAYVMYTSGSTGKPKGVMTTHRALVNRLWWMQQQYPLTAEDRVLQKTPFSFDVSVWEFFWPLLSGARLVMARPGGHKEPGYLRHVLEEQAISVVHFVPSLLQVFLEQTGLERCHRLRHVFCSGEALTVSVQERFFERLAAQLHNLYGPTEAAIEVSAWTCVPGSNVIPIGRPIANTELYILDAHLQPVPIGVAGELHIGGTPLAQGYWNQPQLTAQKFIPHPFRPQERLYKTGDRARFLRDGTIAYLGRIDHQVKLRGLRIELGEIEALLREYVREAVVLLREDAPGDKRLVAYVVGASDSAQLRGLLQQKVPEYMVPAAFVFLEAMPLTPNGKVDRRALPAPAYAGDMAEDGAPRTPVEELLVRLWAQVLGLPQVGIHDNFFALGGHSLLATQVIARVRETFGVEVPLRGLFEAPTIAAFAAYLPAGAGVACLPLDPIAREGALPLSFAQQRLWFLEQLEGPSSTYNLPMPVRLTGPLHRQALQQSLSEVVRRHEALRTRFLAVGGHPVQVIAPPTALDLPMIDLSEIAERDHAVHRYAQVEAQRPFDLEQGPLLRCTLLKLGATEHVLLLTVHHIAADGWSLGVLIRELACLYPAFLQDRPHSLQPLPIQYADFAHWQRHYLTGERLERHLTYWQEHLTGAPPLLALPTDHPRPPVQRFEGAILPVVLPADHAAALQALSRRRGVTLFMTLLAVFQVLLYHATSQEDLVVGTAVANRDPAAVEDLIGFFVNQLVLRTDLSGNPEFQELLQRVRQVTLAAYSHQELPFEALVEHLNPPRDPSHTPLFQVQFVLQNTPLPALEGTDLTLSPLKVDNGTAKFDLLLMLQEDEAGIHGFFQYNTGLFERATVLRLTQHLGLLLQAVIQNPSVHLEELDQLLDTAEDQQQTDQEQSLHVRGHATLRQTRRQTIQRPIC